MPEPGGGDAHRSDPDLDSLPPEIAKQSIASSRIVLPKDAALEALTILAARGRLLENWEGWIRMQDGSRVKSLAHTGSFALSRDVARAADAARAGIDAAQRRWDRAPEYPGATLYFLLAFAPTT